MKENTTWYAIMQDSEDNDWGSGSYDRDEAIRKVKECYPEEGWIAVIDEVWDAAGEKVVDAVMVDEISHSEIFDD